MRLSVLFAQLKKMQVAELLDEYFPTHGNWKGLSLGTVAVGWVSHILSTSGITNGVCGTDGAEDHLTVLQSCLDENVRALDWSDDHLACVLDYLGKDSDWDPFETALGQHADSSIRVKSTDNTLR